MNREDVLECFRKVAKAHEEWEQAYKAHRARLDLLLTRLINEAAANMMHIDEVSRASGQSPAKVRALMRSRGINPKARRALMAKQAGETLANNAALMGIEPREMDLTSPLAYLPMGSELKEFLETKAVSKVTEIPETFEEISSRLTSHIHLGIAAEEDWDGPSIKPGTLTNEQIAWLGSWLAGCGVK